MQGNVFYQNIYMENNRHIIEVEKFIQDRSFILWCLSPDEVSDRIWADYAQKHPDEKEKIQRAKEIVCSALLNSYKLSAHDKMKLKKRIDQDHKSRKVRKQRFFILRLAAACLLILCIGLYYYFEQEKQITPCIAEIEYEQTDTALTEIKLTLANQETVQLSNNATIEIDGKGDIRDAKGIIAAIDRDAPIPERMDTIMKKRMNVLRVPGGRRSSVILADGTKIWVNSDTELRFPEQFDKDNRTIYVNGEIFLEVTRNPSSPFRVITSQMDIKVLGTTFNVMAYKEDILQRIVLKEGSVSIDEHSGKVNVLEPDEMLTLDNGSVTIGHVDVNDYTSWVEGFLQFNQRELDEVLTRLSRYYRVAFECPQELRKMKCSGKLVLFDNLEQVMQTLQASFSLSYTINGDSIMLNVEP